MSKGKVIKSIHLVNQQGIGDMYSVGRNGVTRIIEDFTSDVNGEPVRCSFIISGDSGIIAEISVNTPFVLGYAESEVTNDWVKYNSNKSRWQICY